MLFNPFEQGLTVSEIAKECKTAEGGGGGVKRIAWGGGVGGSAFLRPHPLNGQLLENGIM